MCTISDIDDSFFDNLIHIYFFTRQKLTYYFIQMTSIQKLVLGYSMCLCVNLSTWPTIYNIFSWEQFLPVFPRLYDIFSWEQFLPVFPMLCDILNWEQFLQLVLCSMYEGHSKNTWTMSLSFKLFVRNSKSIHYIL
jgi:hypothetical protein